MVYSLSEKPVYFQMSRSSFLLKVLFIILPFSVLCSVSSMAQLTLNGLVCDASTRKPLAYCNIAIKGSAKGTTTNSEGAFRINAGVNDTLLFSYLGYNTLALSSQQLQSNRQVLLKQKDIVLKELVVHADDDFLYNIIEQCRKNLKHDRNLTESKAYFGLETEISGREAELVECYYNAYLKGISTQELRLKNGRMGLAVVGSRVFNNWDASLVICKLDLLNENGLFPCNPLQCSRKEMKANFNLQLQSSDTSLYIISFIPRTGSNDCFSGEIWIDRHSTLPLKINLKIDDAFSHPFISYLEDSIYGVGMEMNLFFRLGKNVVFPVHTLFDYHFTYITGSGLARLNDVILPEMSRVISSHCVLYYYDYNKPFLLPYFDYDSEVGDYEKIAMIPFNPVFWNTNNALLLTENQKKKLGMFSEKGYLINFTEGNYGKDFCKELNTERHRYFLPYTFWSADKRILLARGLPHTEPYSLAKINQSIQSDLYHLEVQLMLDVTETDDSLVCRTFTVFDEVKTFFHLIQQSYTPVFINIYFDICEIERRKLDEKLHQKQFTLLQIDSIYKESVQNMKSVTLKYLSEVETGKNEKNLLRWNQYVMDHLQIDNYKILTESEE